MARRIYELRVARPENAPFALLAHIPGDRVPIWQGLHPVISKAASAGYAVGRPPGNQYLVASTADGKLNRSPILEKNALSCGRILGRRMGNGLAKAMPISCRWTGF